MTIGALLAPTTQQVVVAVIVNGLVKMGIRADRWPQEGTAISIITTVAALFAAAINVTIIPAISAGFLPTAARGWLTWVAYYVYGVTRVSATFATGEITLTNNGGGSFAFDPGEVTFQNPTTKATYTNVDPISLGPGPATTTTVGIQATAPGTASNSAPGDVTVIVTTMLGVTAANAIAVLGLDEQSDASLQALCWNAIPANSAYGPAQAVGYAIQTATRIDGTPVNINRYQSSESSHTGALTVYVASPSGSVDPGDETAVLNNILAIARPPCVQVTVTPASPVSVADALTVYVTATPGLDAGAVSDAIETSLDDFFAAYPIGGKTAGLTTALFASAIEGACYAAWPGVFDVQGAADHLLTAGQVAANATTVTVRIV
jgi:hypothetical protein